VGFANPFYTITSGMRLDITFFGTCGIAAVTFLFILPTFYDEIVYDGVIVPALPLLYIECTSLLPNTIVVVSQRVEGIISQHLRSWNLWSLNRVLGDFDDEICVLRGDG
jgi:hypothetical protein